MSNSNVATPDVHRRASYYVSTFTEPTREDLLKMYEHAFGWLMADLYWLKLPFPTKVDFEIKQDIFDWEVIVTVCEPNENGAE